MGSPVGHVGEYEKKHRRICKNFDIDQLQPSYSEEQIRCAGIICQEEEESLGRLGHAWAFAIHIYNLSINPNAGAIGIPLELCNQLQTSSVHTTRISLT